MLLLLQLLLSELRIVLLLHALLLRAEGVSEETSALCGCSSEEARVLYGLSVSEETCSLLRRLLRSGASKHTPSLLRRASKKTPSLLRRLLRRRASKKTSSALLRRLSSYTPAEQTLLRRLRSRASKKTSGGRLRAAKEPAPRRLTAAEDGHGSLHKTMGHNRSAALCLSTVGVKLRLCGEKNSRRLKTRIPPDAIAILIINTARRNLMAVT